MNPLQSNRVFKNWKRSIDEAHTIFSGENIVGYWVGLNALNPYAKIIFSEQSIRLEVFGQVPVEISYSHILGVSLPNTQKEPPQVVVWAEGYFMLHQVVLEVSSGKVVVPSGVIPSGKSWAYLWHDIVAAILAANGVH